MGKATPFYSTKPIIVSVLKNKEKKYDKALEALEKALVKPEIDIDARKVGPGFFKLEGYKKSDKIYQKLESLNKQHYDKHLAICNEILEKYPENKSALQLKNKINRYLSN